MPHTATKPSSASSGSVSRSSQISSRIAGKRRGAQRFGARHQPAPRDAVGEQAGGDREQDERQRQRGLQQAGLAFADAEQQHRDDRGRGQRDLLGRLGGEVGPGQAVEGFGQMKGVGGLDMARFPEIVSATSSAVRTANPPASRQHGYASQAFQREVARRVVRKETCPTGQMQLQMSCNKDE